MEKLAIGAAGHLMRQGNPIACCGEELPPSPPVRYLVFADQIISALSIVEIRIFEVIKCKGKTGFCRKSLHFKR
ncbi:hypothetical protein IM774_12400 [Erysipelotrichaceae bacterium RD49]|nr:hypothetical protein [Erysipelotrichaceae bacterium RD49]